MLRRTLGKLFISLGRQALLLGDAVSQKDTFDGIKIVDMIHEVPDESDSLAFIPTAKRALALIRERDPVRYRRLKESLIAIRSLQSEPFPAYHDYLRSCHLNFETYRQRILNTLPEEQDDQQVIESLLTADLATTLIHESTHGFLNDRGVGYGDKDWLAVEKRCRREEIRFAKKALTDVPGYEGGLMDWDYWNDFGPRQKSWYEDYRDLSRWDIIRHRHNLLFGAGQSDPLLPMEPEVPNTIDLQWFANHVTYLESLISDESTDVAAISDRGQRYDKVGLLKDAIADQRRALEINPHSWQCWSRLIGNLMQAGEFDEVLEKTTWRYHDEPNLQNLTWMAWYQVQLCHPDGPQNMELVLQHQDLKEDQRDYYQRMNAICLSEFGKTEEALDLLETGWPEDSCSCGLMSRQHNVLMKAGREIDALERRETFLQFRCDSDVQDKEHYRRLPSFVLSSDRDLSRIEYLNPEAIVLVGSDPRLVQNPGELSEIADGLRKRLQSNETAELEKGYLAAAMLGCMDTYNQCYRLPSDWTGGFDVYTCSISIHRACLRGGILNGSLIWIMAMQLDWILDEQENHAGFESPYVYATETEFANIDWPNDRGCGILSRQTEDIPASA